MNIKRFTIKLVAVDSLDGLHCEAWEVRDEAAKDYNMPVRACAINLSKANAEKVCEIMNEEWRSFINKPW